MHLGASLASKLALGSCVFNEVIFENCKNRNFLPYSSYHKELQIKITYNKLPKRPFKWSLEVGESEKKLNSCTLKFDVFSENGHYLNQFCSQCNGGRSVYNWKKGCRKKMQNKMGKKKDAKTKKGLFDNYRGSLINMTLISTVLAITWFLSRFSTGR